MTLCNGFNMTQNDGGEYTMGMAYLAAWKGPVYEKDDPYGDKDVYKRQLLIDRGLDQNNANNVRMESGKDHFRGKSESCMKF